MKHATLVFKKELCNELGISRTTLYRWMRDAGIDSKRGLITREQADEIREKVLPRKTAKRNGTKWNQMSRNGISVLRYFCICLNYPEFLFLNF